MKSFDSDQLKHVTLTQLGKGLRLIEYRIDSLARSEGGEVHVRERLGGFEGGYRGTINTGTARRV